LKKIYWILFVGGLIFCGYLLRSNGKEAAEAAFKEQKPVKELSLYQFSAPDSLLSLAQVRQLPLHRWDSVPAINFGNKGGTGWTYSAIYSPRRQTVWLEFPSHFIDSVKVWLISDSGAILEYPVTGFWHLAKVRHNYIQHRYFLFPLSLEARQTYQIFIKGYVMPGFTLKYEVRYWAPEKFIDSFRRADWGWALFVGIMFMVIIVAIINFIFHPRPIYYYYAGYVVCLTLYALLNDGWGIYLPGFLQQKIDSIFIAYPLILGLGFFLLFSRQFLVITPQAGQWWLRLSPWWLWLLLTAFIGLGQYGANQQFLTLVHLSYRIGLLLTLALALLWLSYVWQALQKGFQPAWLLLSSQMVMIVYYGTNVFLENTGLIKHAIPDMLIFRMALVTEIIIITIGWVYRQKVIRESQELLQNELQHQRVRLARDLHDDIGSDLTHIVSRLDSLAYYTSATKQQQFENLINSTRASIDNLSDFTRESIENLRDIIWVLDQPTITLPHFAIRVHEILLRLWKGLETPLLHWQVAIVPNNLEMPPLVVHHVFRITKEATNNALKHAKATQICVRLETQLPDLLLTISDNGKGFDLHKETSGYGLTNMRRRAEEFGGLFCLQSNSRGTRISVKIPLKT
jgi:signal transduction histidine kinase